MPQRTRSALRNGGWPTCMSRRPGSPPAARGSPSPCSAAVWSRTDPDLTGSVITGPDFTGSGETPATPSWGIEGTSAASIIAGHGDNVGDAVGIIGIAPAARILSIRVALDATDPLNANPAAVQGLPAAIAAGIRYAAAHGAQVIDLPLDPASLASDGAATGGLAAAAGGSAAERAAVDYALGKGAVLVAPAGDNGEDGNEPTFPAAYSGVIALGAVDRHFVRAAFSNRQSYVALTAPGVNLTTASPPSGYRNMSTTDAASAVVAGIAALIRSRYPTLTSSQVRQALVNGSVPRPPSATTRGLRRGHGGRAEGRPGGGAHRRRTRRRASRVGHGSGARRGRPGPAARSARNGHPGPGQDGAPRRGHGRGAADRSAAGEPDRYPGPAAAPNAARFPHRNREPCSTPRPDRRRPQPGTPGTPGSSRRSAPPPRTWPRREQRHGGRPRVSRAGDRTAGPRSGAPIWSPNRPAAARARLAADPPRILPVPGASAFRARRHPGVRAGPAGRVHARRAGFPERPVPAGTLPARGGARRQNPQKGAASAAERPVPDEFPDQRTRPRAGDTPVAGTVHRVSGHVPGGPPWEPARMPEGGFPRRRDAPGRGSVRPVPAAGPVPAPGRYPGRATASLPGRRPRRGSPESTRPYARPREPPACSHRDPPGAPVTAFPARPGRATRRRPAGGRQPAGPAAPPAAARRAGTPGGSRCPRPGRSPDRPPVCERPAHGARTTWATRTTHAAWATWAHRAAGRPASDRPAVEFRGLVRATTRAIAGLPTASPEPGAAGHGAARAPGSFGRNPGPGRRRTRAGTPRRPAPARTRARARPPRREPGRWAAVRPALRLESGAR